MKKLILIIALLLAPILHAAPAPVPAGKPPTKKEIAAAVQVYLHPRLKDPMSVIDLGMSKPVWNVKPQGWLVQLEYNCKNALGGYIGLHPSSVIIDNGKVAWDKRAVAWDDVIPPGWIEMQ